jgi:hypothetical protein
MTVWLVFSATKFECASLVGSAAIVVNDNVATTTALANRNI